MDTATDSPDHPSPALAQRTDHWGDWSAVSLYLDRCQVDTPNALVEAIWTRIGELRSTIGKVVDFGAGDARFAKNATFGEYVGYEIDEDRHAGVELPANARIINHCAFADHIANADICLGNPPYVRNQDLPIGWRTSASDILIDRTGVAVSGLANAWQYFFLLSLASTKPDGLCALILPFEWVSRPSALPLRDYIRRNQWDVAVYRLSDTTFNHVLTTSSITIVDKAVRTEQWHYYEQTTKGSFAPLDSPAGSDLGVVPYLPRTAINPDSPCAKRGLSPGSQKILTLTEGERVRNGLSVTIDVVRCVTSLRRLPTDVPRLDRTAFNRYYRDQGAKCWLIRTDREPSSALRLYLDSIPESSYQTATCLNRSVWWQFTMPKVPDALFAQSFKGTFPKCAKNTAQAHAVGGVCGLYNITDRQFDVVATGFRGLDLRDRVVAHSNGFRKIEIGQLNALLQQEFQIGDA